MSTHTYAPLFGRRIRVTQMLGTGVVGANYFVTDGFVSFSLTAETEDGAEIILRNAQNQLCINERLASTFKRLSVSVRFCGVNPLLYSWMSNAESYNDWAGDPAGFTLSEGPIEGNFGLELFTGLAGSLNDVNANGYALLPFMQKGTLADIELTGEDAVDFSIQNMLSVSGHSWGTGPYDVLMGPGTSEAQVITITGVPTGGSFTLSFNGQTTGAIAYNATSAAVLAALEGLGNIAVGDVTVTGGPLPATAVTVTFKSSLGNVAAMTATSSLTGGTTPAVAVTSPTPGVSGVPSKLPTPLDTLTHFLLIDTAVAAPAVTAEPTLVVV